MPGKNTREPLVTVCVPTIGRTEYLGDTLRAIQDQTYQNLEVLVLDNASPEDANGLLDRFVGALPSCRRLRVSDRLPMFQNFNRGVSEARGDYVVFFHDDDVYEPDFLRRHVSLLEEYPEAVFAGGNYDLVDGAGRRTSRRRFIRRTEVWESHRFIDDLLRRGRCALPTPGIVFRRAALQKEGFDPDLPMNWGDFTVLMRLAEQGRVVVVKDVHYSWRVHGQNNSNLPFREAIPLRTRVCQSYLEEFAERHPGEESRVKRWNAMVTRNHKLGLLWGWWAGQDSQDAESCRRELGRSQRGQILPALLRLIDRAGLTLRRRRAMLPAMRSLTRVLSS